MATGASGKSQKPWLGSGVKMFTEAFASVEIRLRNDDGGGGGGKTHLH